MRGAFLEEDAEQQKSCWRDHMGAIQCDQGTNAVIATKACASLSEAQATRSVVNQSAEERGAAIPHATFCGSRERATAPDDPVGGG